MHAFAFRKVKVCKMRIFRENSASNHFSQALDPASPLGSSPSIMFVACAVHIWMRHELTIPPSFPSKGETALVRLPEPLFPTCLPLKKMTP